MRKRLSCLAARVHGALGHHIIHSLVMRLDRNRVEQLERITQADSYHSDRRLRYEAIVVAAATAEPIARAREAKAGDA